MIACISIPYFAAAVERRARSPLATTPLAIGGQPWEARPIFAFSQEVARQGVKAGMSLRLAHVLSPEARFLPATPPRYIQASGEVVDVLLDFAPAVEPQELWHPFAEAGLQFTVDGCYLPARYFLDFDGLPEPESLRLAREMGSFLREATQFAPAIGLATQKFAAQVAATLSRPHHARVVSPGDDARFLAGQPVSFLPLEGEIARRLHLLGIRTLGDLARLPRAGLLTQFGPAIEPLHRLACGQPPNRPTAPPRTSPAHEQASHEFEPAVSDRQVLATVARRLAARLAEHLQAESLAVRGVYLAWETDDGRRDQNTLALRRATAERRHLTDAWLDLLDALVAGLAAEQAAGDTGEDARPPGISRLTLGSRDLVPAAARQMSLFDEAGDRLGRELRQSIRALLARHDAGCFFQPELTESDHPLPERRFQLNPMAYDPAVA